MTNLLKKQVARILEKDVNDEEFDHFMIILDQGGGWEQKQDVSTTEISQKVQNFFLGNIQDFLQQYSPLYSEFKEIIESVSDLDTSLNRMEECMGELRIKNMIILSKLQKLQVKEGQIDEKISLMNELMSKISLDKSQLETFLSDETLVDDKFLDLFDTMDSIEEMDNFLIGNELSNTTLRNSLLKNTNEIKSIGFTKLLKYLNRNIESVPHELLKKSIQLIVTNRKLQENLQKILAIRKNVLNNRFKNASAKYEKTEDASEFFWALAKEVEESFFNELDLFTGEEKMDLKAMEFLFEDILRDIEIKLSKYTQQEQNFLEAYKITNYFYYLDSTITAKVNEYTPGYFEATPTSKLRIHLTNFTNISSEYFRKRLDRSVELASDNSNFDLADQLSILYDTFEKVKVVLRYIDSSFLPTSRDEKVLPVNRAFYVPPLTLLMTPLNKAVHTLLNLPRDKAREGHIHVILFLSNLEKLYRELKLAMKKMEELGRSYENVGNHLKETIVTLCVLNLRESLAEYDISKDLIKASIEGEKVDIIFDDKSFIYKESIGKLLGFCMAVCRKDINVKRTEAEAFLEEEYRKRIERRFKELVMVVYEKGLKKLLDYGEENYAGEALDRKLERIFDLDEGKIALENIEVMRKKFVGEKENEVDIEANL